MVGSSSTPLALPPRLLRADWIGGTPRAGVLQLRFLCALPAKGHGTDKALVGGLLASAPTMSDC